MDERDNKQQLASGTDVLWFFRSADEGAYPELPCWQSIKALQSASDADLAHQAEAAFTGLCKLFDGALHRIYDPAPAKTEELLLIARPLIDEIIHPLLEHGSYDANTVYHVMSFFAAVVMFAEMRSLPTGLEELSAHNDDTEMLLDLMRRAADQLLDCSSHSDAHRIIAVVIVRTRMLAGYVLNAQNLSFHRLGPTIGEPR